MHIKICCIRSIAEAQMAIDHGAYAIGLVGKMPSGPGPIEDERIAEIAAWAPSSVETFLLTSETEAENIITHHKCTGTTTIQLVDAVRLSDYPRIRKVLHGVRIVQVIHVSDDSSLAEARLAAPHVDMLLLDSGNPRAAIRELGGTGRTHDWNISRRIVEDVDIPVFLAGGLNPGNVAAAIRQVRPYGVDLCSGVRTNGALDKDKLRAFVNAVR